MGQVSMRQLAIARLDFVRDRFRSLEVQSSRFSEEVVILSASTEEYISLRDSKSDGLSVSSSLVKSIEINDYVDTGVFYLGVEKWQQPGSALNIDTLSTGRFFLSKSLPAKITTSGFTFAGADWGDSPQPQLKQWMASSSSYTPGLYAALAASYLAGGQSGVASDILIAKQNADYANSSFVSEKTYLFVTWLLADYGYHPEIGLLWIIAFVGIATIVFKSGDTALRSKVRPRNWFVFAFDSVIPGIQLDNQHKDIRFHDWRQYFLYFLRFLSAVVVVLVIELLKKSLSGLG
jgi:hypothetical protein